MPEAVEGYVFFVSGFRNPLLERLILHSSGPVSYTHLSHKLHTLSEHIFFDIMDIRSEIILLFRYLAKFNHCA